MMRHRLAAVSWLMLLLNGAVSGQDNTWELMIGYGESPPGRGDTRERVETRDLILRQTRPNDSSHGQGWYLLQCLLYLHCAPRYQPYLFAGGGPLYTQAEIPGTSSKLKGVYQAGLGVDSTWKMPVSSWSSVSTTSRMAAWKSPTIR